MKQWAEKLKSCKKDQILILLLTGVLLLVISLPVNEEKPEVTQENAAEEIVLQQVSKTQELESRLEDILSHVEGIGNVEVMLTLKSDGKRIVEKDTDQSSGSSESSEENAADASEESSIQESTVLQKDSAGNEIPYVSEELEPEISGVLVIAQGAGNAGTVSEITDAVMALFGVEAHKIKVMKMQ